MRPFYLLALIALTGCASNPQLGNVMPREGGLYDVNANGETEDDALKSATYTAKKTCDARTMRYVVIESKTTYKGLVSEKTNQMIGAAQNILNMTSGKLIPTLSGDDDYKVSMKFKCES